MNGCEFLREKGEELEWDHQQLFQYFAAEMLPFTTNIKKTCCAMLHFFHSIETFEIELTAEIEKNYELFMDIYHYQQFIEHKEDIIPPIEVQLMWIVHCLHPVEYYKDCFFKYKKLLNVKILSLPISNAKYQQQIPHLNEFGNYLKSKLNANLFSPITRSLETLQTINTRNQRQTKNSWFIRNLHMKNSILQQIEFINKINHISKFKTFNDADIYKSMHRYLQFLYLMALPMNKRPPICVATIDIDLIWHAHILNFSDYYSMSKMLFPQIDIIPHNHSIPLIIEKQNKYITEIFWNQIFGENNYLNGRPFYIAMCHDVSTKKRKIIRNKTPKHPKPPIALTLDLTPSPSPRLHPVTITRISSGTATEMEMEMELEAATKTSEISIKMLMDGKKEGNCYWPCELCKDCYEWSFKIHRKANICIICCISVCVALFLMLFGAFVFIPNAPMLTDGIIIDLYENNVTINNDSSITINCLAIYDAVGYNNNNHHLSKSISYKMNGIGNDDIVGFDGGDFVGEPYINDAYYYVDMVMDPNYNSISFNYTLSSSYFCCNSNNDNNECNEIGFFLPWMNKWEYPSRIKQFSVNVFYNNYDFSSVYSNFGGNNDKKNGIFYLSKNDIDINKDLNIYFELFSNSNNMELNQFVECSEQFEYFIDDDSFQYIQQNEYQTIMTLFDFILISLSIILFVICSCYGCCWIMYLFDNSCFCDLCAVIL